MLSFLSYYATKSINVYLVIQSQCENNSTLPILENTINVHATVLMDLNPNAWSFAPNPQTMK